MHSVIDVCCRRLLLRGVIEQVAPPQMKALASIVQAHRNDVLYALFAWLVFLRAVRRLPLILMVETSPVRRL